jgi:hypothetical protein
MIPPPPRTLLHVYVTLILWILYFVKPKARVQYQICHVGADGGFSQCATLFMVLQNMATYLLQLMPGVHRVSKTVEGISKF